MERSSRHRWVVSVVAALVVGAVLVTGWVLGRPGSVSGEIPVAGGGGGASEQPADPGGGTSGSRGSRGSGGGTDETTGDRQAGGRDPVLVEGRVRIDGYAVRRDRLVLRYTTGVPECYGSVAVHQVIEEADAVTVTLVSVPPRDPADACIDLAVVGTVGTRLEAPLGERVVLDGGFRPPVVVRRAVGGQVLPGEGT